MPTPRVTCKIYLSSGTALLFLLVNIRYLDNCDGGDLMIEIKAGPGNSGGCITVVVDPLQFLLLPS